MTDRRTAPTLAAALACGLLATAVYSTPAQVQAAKKPAPTPTATLTPVPTSTPVPTVTPPPFTVTAWVDPSTMPYNYYPTLYGQTLPGASCSASVVYNNGRVPTSFSGTTQTVPASGLVGWTWHEETTSSGGTGMVTCTYGGQTKSATATFVV